jgi:hypothetical protein
MELTAEEIRVLGVLMEKEATTPDHYPMSTNALTNACNQKTSRDPVVDYDQHTVSSTMLLLRPAGLARTVISGRTEKHRHVMDEALGLDHGEVALLAVLMLRGPQTPGELRTRTERAHGFESVVEVESVLAALADRSEPLVRNLGRGPGQSQDRWLHLLGDAAALTQAAQAGERVQTSAEAPSSTGLEARVAELERRISALEAELGL